MARRNPFAAPEPNGWQDKTWDQVVTNEDGNTNNDSRLNVPVPVDYLPPTVKDRASEKKKRKRNWDNAHPVTSFRSVPDDLHNSMKGIAKELQVPLGDVVRSFLEYGLTTYHANGLLLKPEMKDGKWTLYPSSWGAKTGMRKANPAMRTKSRNTKIGQNLNKHPRTWESIRAYHIPNEIHQAVKKLAAELNVPVGNVFCRLTEYSLAEYIAGKLVPNIYPAENIKMTLNMEKRA